MNVTDSNAASSAATQVAEPVEIENLTDEQHSTWLKTGDLPAKPVEGESATPKPAVEAPKPDADGKTPESGTGKNPGGDKERNWKELRESAKKEKERADRLEAELAEAKKASGAKKDEPAKPQELPPGPKEPEKPKRPRLAEFNTHDEYETAMDKYEQEMLEFPGKKAAFDSQKAAYEKGRSEFESHQQKLTDTWKTIAGKGREIYGDFDKVALAPDLPLRENEPVERYLRDSEPDVAAHLLQYFGHKREDLARISALSSRQQYKELEALEKAVVEEIAGKKTSAKPSEQSQPPKRVTAALAPPSEVGGKGTAPGDEEEAALRDGDTDRYIALANKRDLARRKSGR